MAAHYADNDTANNLRNYTTPRDSYAGHYGSAAGHTELERWTRGGFERGTWFHKGER